MDRRVVVTGVGVVSPLGVGASVAWGNLVQGRSGLVALDEVFSPECFPKLRSRVFAAIPKGSDKGALQLEALFSSAECRRYDPVILFGLLAAREALGDAGFFPLGEEDEKAWRIGVNVGAGGGALDVISRAAIQFPQKDPSPFSLLGYLFSTIPSLISIEYGLRGPVLATSSACATSAHAIGESARAIRSGDVDVMVAGGTDDTSAILAFASFDAMRALSHGYNDRPTAASRPWDRDRDGFVGAQGAGVVVLEEYVHAQKRGAHIYGELLGYGATGDAYHVAMPHPRGVGARGAMENALRQGKVNLESVGYINAHATSTPQGDRAELEGILSLYEGHGADVRNVAISSTKGATGHLLGGAGAVEAIFSLLAIRDGVVPPTLNLDSPDVPVTGLNLVPHKAQQRKLNNVLSNSFGFGGLNASLLFGNL